jgi:hypothetical protein
VAAVAGHEAALRLVAEVCGLSESQVRERLRPARRAGVVEEIAPGQAAFTHALFRERQLLGVFPHTFLMRPP